MEQDFYRGRLEQRHGLEVIVPEPEAREIVHRVIYDELCHGMIRDSSRAAYRGIIGDLVKKGAQGSSPAAPRSNYWCATRTARCRFSDDGDPCRRGG